MAKCLQKGIIFILSAPSGCGKTSITRELLKILSNLMLSISHTTRKPRGNEKNGKEYYFCSTIEFFEQVKQDKFLEHAEIYSNYYGTLLEPILTAISNGTDILFDIDAQGAEIIKQKIYSKIISIFILPPTIKHLENRLINRGDEHDKINLRLSSALLEIKTAKQYDYIIINDQLEAAVEEIKTIITAERIKNSKNTKLSFFI